MLLWDLLSPEAIGKLYGYQMEQYGLKLVDPHEPVKAVTVGGEVEPAEQIDKLMRQARGRD